MRAGIRPKKSLGQHFLADPNYCKKILRYAEIQAADTVIEIGPGTGQLTECLLAAAGRVVAIEFDPALVEYLKDRFTDQAHLELVQADILHLDWSDMIRGASVKIVGNLPYNIATPILLKTTQITDRFQSFTFMVQREVARRILAQAGSKDYGYFTLLMAYHFERLRGFDVPPGVFVPKPRVLSHVMKLIPRDPPHPVPDYDRFLGLLKRAFRHRRKTLRNNLQEAVSEPRRFAAALEQCRVAPEARPEQVTLQQYSCLARML